MKKLKLRWKDYYRRYIGFSVMLLGAALVIEHYITYGGTMHYTLCDHGLAGVILFVIGALAAGLKAGHHAKKETK
jgi:hypothetical protein